MHKTSECYTFTKNWLVAISTFWLFRLTFAETNNIFDLAESELTVNVKSGATECFFQRAKPGEILEIEYQVVDANFGDVEANTNLDINFYFYSPRGQELIMDWRKSDATHNYEVKEEGDHKLCFDNSFSHFSSKTIYFEIYIDSKTDNDDWEDFVMSFPPELVYNETIDVIKESMNRVKDNLNKIKHFQDQMRAIEARDRNIQEHNFTKVNLYSFATIFVMIIVGTVQVIMVRSLFEEKSRLHKIFKLLS